MAASGGTDFVVHFRNSAYAVATPTRRKRYWFADGAWLDMTTEGAPVEISLTQWLADRGVEVSGTTFDEDYARELHARSRRAGPAMDATLEILRTRGLIESVLYCGTQTDVELAILERGPVILTMEWRQSMFEPEPVDGRTVCRVDLDSSVVGGHVVQLNGIDLDLELGGTTGFVRMKNSWGRSWGDNGSALISLADVAKLMRDSGSAFLPVPPAQVLATKGGQRMAPEESPETVTFERYQQAAIASDLWTTMDSLGYAAYADAIARGIQYKDTRPPLTIGIKAPWGAGKTSLMRMVRDRLEWPGGNRAARHTGEPRTIGFGSGTWRRLTYRAVLAQLRGDREPPTMTAGPDPDERRWRPTVWFNPWTYQTTQQVWAGLAHEIITQITDRMSRAERERFWFRLNLRRIDEHAVRRRIYAIILGRVVPIAVAAVVVLVAGLVLLAVGAPRWIGLVLTGGSPVALALVAAAQAFTVLRTRIGGPLARLAGPAAELPESLVRAPDYHTDAGYLSALQEDLRNVLGLVARPERPLVVFIDDLDRCAPGTVVQVIEAVNSFLAGEFPNAVFVIALEPRMVAAHIETAYADLAAKVSDGGGLGWRFLDKFIQLPLTLPVMDPDQSTDLLNSLFPVIPPDGAVTVFPPPVGLSYFIPTTTEGQPVVPPEAAATAVARQYVDRQLSTDSPEIKRVIAYGARVLEPNPRALKRFVNVFRFFVMIHTERRLRGLPTPDSHDALDALAKLSVLAVRWPDLLTSLIDRSENGRNVLDMLENDESVPNLDSVELKEFLRAGPRIAQHARHYL